MRLQAITSPLSVLIIVCLGVFVAALDQTVVVTALPSVMLDLGIPLTELDHASWIITGYLLGYTVAMPLMGRISDVYGHARIYQVALVLFALGSLLVALSPSLSWIVGSRVLQALGGGATVPIGMAIASGVLPPERRGLALGLIGAAAEAGSVLGPIYGGAIIHFMDWRWIFWLNLPLSAVLVASLALLPNQRRESARVDYVGGLLLAGGLAILSIALSQREVFTATSSIPYFLVGVGVLVVLTLVFWERRYWQPLLSPLLFRSAAFLTANATQFLVGVALIMAMVNIPLMADTVMGQEPLQGGFRLVRLTAAIPLGAILGGYLMARVGVRRITTVGLLLMALGFYFMRGWGAQVEDPGHTFHLLVGGLGFGLVIAPILLTAISAATEEYRGTAASLVTVARMMGMTLGLAALSAWGMDQFQQLTVGLELPLSGFGETAEQFQRRSLEYDTSLTQAGVTLFHRFFYVAMWVSLAAILPALLMRPGRR